MVPVTPGGELAVRLRRVLTSVKGPRGTSVKVEEKPGDGVFSRMAPKHPFNRWSCERDECPIKISGRGCNERCTKEGIIYKATCNLCMDINKELRYEYIGETSRTLYTRAGQHIRVYNSTVRSTGNNPSQDADETDDTLSSWILDHKLKCHPDLNIIDPLKDFTWGVVKNHRDPLTRVTEEAVRIQQALSGTSRPFSLNRKGEYFAAKERWETR